MRQTEKNRKKTGNGNSKARDPRYDCLRAVSVMAIIMVHAMPVESVLLRWEFRFWSMALFTIVIMSMRTEWFCLSGSMPAGIWHRC